MTTLKTIKYKQKKKTKPSSIQKQSNTIPKTIKVGLGLITIAGILNFLHEFREYTNKEIKSKQQKLLQLYESQDKSKMSEINKLESELSDLYR
jgi:hypothetical protein